MVVTAKFLPSIKFSHGVKVQRGIVHAYSSFTFYWFVERNGKSYNSIRALVSEDTERGIVLRYRYYL